MIEGKCLVKCTDGKSRVAGICTPPPDKKGYCILDRDDFYILKTDNTPGWKSGDKCWTTDGNITAYDDITDMNKKLCYGGRPIDTCKAFIGPDGNVTF